MFYGKVGSSCLWNYNVFAKRKFNWGCWDDILKAWFLSSCNILIFKNLGLFFVCLRFFVCFFNSKEKIRVFWSFCTVILAKCCQQALNSPNQSSPSCSQGGTQLACRLHNPLGSCPAGVGTVLGRMVVGCHPSLSRLLLNPQHSKPVMLLQWGRSSFGWFFCTRFLFY